MAISEATIQELKQVLMEDYGKDVTQVEASEIVIRLLDTLIYLPRFITEKL